MILTRPTWSVKGFTLFVLDNPHAVAKSGPINSRPPGPAILRFSDPPTTTQIQRHNVLGSTSVSRSLPLSVAGSNVQKSAQPNVSQSLTNFNQYAQKSPTQVAVTTYTIGYE
eukprot:TRINITY_DN7397_c0_g1_i10.p1 TRINITY_DN7397_c0_g1~~TRINITY_DN7397_c0_g1_i10.p1  ORF type:complete len:112 (-),score=5.97 TRINITY_DN7397_c0_g1_i10:47-382(-)